MEDEKIERRETRISRGSTLRPTSTGYNLICYIFIIFSQCVIIYCVRSYLQDNNKQLLTLLNNVRFYSRCVLSHEISFTQKSVGKCISKSVIKYSNILFQQCLLSQFRAILSCYYFREYLNFPLLKFIKFLTRARHHDSNLDLYSLKCMTR